MRLHRCAAIVVVLAWVVWVKHTGPEMPEPDWSVYKTVNGEAACKTEARGIAELAAETTRLLGYPAKVFGDTVLVSDGLWGSTTEYKCVPDTVDPRRPAGNGTTVPDVAATPRR